MTRESTVANAKSDLHHKKIRFAAALRYLAKRQNMSQKEIARKLDVREATVSSWVNETSPNFPQLPVFLDLCELLKASPEIFTLGIDDYDPSRMLQYENRLNHHLELMAKYNNDTYNIMIDAIMEIPERELKGLSKHLLYLLKPYIRPA